MMCCSRVPSSKSSENMSSVPSITTTNVEIQIKERYTSGGLLLFISRVNGNAITISKKTRTGPIHALLRLNNLYASTKSNLLVINFYFPILIF